MNETAATLKEVDEVSPEHHHHDDDNNNINNNDDAVVGVERGSMSFQYDDDDDHGDDSHDDCVRHDPGCCRHCPEAKTMHHCHLDLRPLIELAQMDSTTYQAHLLLLSTAAATKRTATTTTTTAGACASNCFQLGSCCSCPCDCYCSNNTAAVSTTIPTHRCCHGHGHHRHHCDALYQAIHTLQGRLVVAGHENAAQALDLQQQNTALVELSQRQRRTRTQALRQRTQYKHLHQQHEQLLAQYHHRTRQWQKQITQTQLLQQQYTALQELHMAWQVQLHQQQVGATTTTTAAAAAAVQHEQQEVQPHRAQPVTPTTVVTQAGVAAVTLAMTPPPSSLSSSSSSHQTAITKKTAMVGTTSTQAAIGSIEIQHENAPLPSPPPSSPSPTLPRPSQQSSSSVVTVAMTDPWHFPKNPLAHLMAGIGHVVNGTGGSAVGASAGTGAAGVGGVSVSVASGSAVVAPTPDPTATAVAQQQPSSSSSLSTILEIPHGMRLGLQFVALPVVVDDETMELLSNDPRVNSSAPSNGSESWPVPGLATRGTTITTTTTTSTVAAAVAKSTNDPVTARISYGRFPSIKAPPSPTAVTTGGKGLLDAVLGTVMTGDEKAVVAIAPSSTPTTTPQRSLSDQDVRARAATATIPTVERTAEDATITSVSTHHATTTCNTEMGTKLKNNMPSSTIMESSSSTREFIVVVAGYDSPLPTATMPTGVKATTTTTTITNDASAVGPVDVTTTSDRCSQYALPTIGTRLVRIQQQDIVDLVCELETLQSSEQQHQQNQSDTLTTTLADRIVEHVQAALQRATISAVAATEAVTTAGLGHDDHENHDNNDIHHDSCYTVTFRNDPLSPQQQVWLQQAIMAMANNKNKNDDDSISNNQTTTQRDRNEQGQPKQQQGDDDWSSNNNEELPMACTAIPSSSSPSLCSVMFSHRDEVVSCSASSSSSSSCLAVTHDGIDLTQSNRSLTNPHETTAASIKQVTSVANKAQDKPLDETLNNSNRYPTKNPGLVAGIPFPFWGKPRSNNMHNNNTNNNNDDCSNSRRMNNIHSKISTSDHDPLLGKLMSQCNSAPLDSSLTLYSADGNDNHANNKVMMVSDDEENNLPQLELLSSTTDGTGVATESPPPLPVSRRLHDDQSASYAPAAASVSTSFGSTGSALLMLPPLPFWKSKLARTTPATIGCGAGGCGGVSSAGFAPSPDDDVDHRRGHCYSPTITATQLQLYCDHDEDEDNDADNDHNHHDHPPSLLSCPESLTESDVSESNCSLNTSIGTFDSRGNSNESMTGVVGDDHDDELSDHPRYHNYLGRDATGFQRNGCLSSSSSSSVPPPSNNNACHSRNIESISTTTTTTSDARNISLSTKKNAIGTGIRVGMFFSLPFQQ